MLSHADEAAAVLKVGIEFGKTYEVPERAAREVPYADRLELEQEINL